ncbi:MAG: phosphoribosyltransferase [Pseudomonadota bacterium]|nr:phosphoribosyltransferase [Pseudomonadota bacterium]
MIRTVTFASCYVYSPIGTGALCERSRLLRSMLKRGDARFISKYAVRVRQQADNTSHLAGFFDSADVLVPVPGSAPHIAGGLWAAQHLSVALVNEGLGSRAWTGLHRVRPVPKSATAAPGDRPTAPLHYESFAVEHTSLPLESIVLIDDVVTKGRTLLAAASRVQEAFPQARIRAFALVRTMGFIGGINQLLDPCKGVIRWQSGDAQRRP